MISSVSCGSSLKFDPNFYKGDHKNMLIKDRHGIEILCEEEKFSEFACMHKDKIKELAKLLRKVRMPKSLRKKVNKALEQAQ